MGVFAGDMAEEMGETGGEEGEGEGGGAVKGRWWLFILCGGVGLIVDEKNRGYLRDIAMNQSA